MSGEPFPRAAVSTALPGLERTNMITINYDYAQIFVKQAGTAPLCSLTERQDPMRLAGRTAIVTGSSSGIGWAIALRFAREGVSWSATSAKTPFGAVRTKDPQLT